MALVILSTHPVQYHAPVYRELSVKFKVPLTVIYESDFSVRGYHDPSFQETFKWDTDLMGGYASTVLRGSEQGLGQLIDNYQPTVILVQGYGTMFDRACIFYALTRRYPLMLRAEVNDECKIRHPFKQIVRDIILRCFYKRVQALLYIGDASKRHYLRLGADEEKLFFSPYCVDTASFKSDESAKQVLRPLMRRKLGLKEDQILIIFSGKLVERKNPKIILNAILKTPEAIQGKISVLFLGSGPMRNELEGAAARSKIEVFFSGFKNQTELSPYYHAADFLILPSTQSETWGLVVNEALAHGLPAVTSNRVGCHSDLIEPCVTGEVFRSGDANDLALAITRVLGYLKQKNTHQRCREKAAVYSVEAAAAGIAEAYADISKR